MKSWISIFIFVFFCQIQAGDHLLYFGINTSTFADADAKPLMGMSLGYNHQWHICKTFAIVTGFEYITRGARLENKTIFPVGTYVFVKNINVRVGYLMPTLSLKCFIMNSPISLSAGIMPCLAVHDGSTSEIIESWSKWDLPYEFPPEWADYYPNEHGPLGIIESSTLSIHFDIGFNLKDFCTQLRVMSDIMGDVGPVDGVSYLHHKLITGQLIVSYFL